MAETAVQNTAKELNWGAPCTPTGSTTGPGLMAGMIWAMATAAPSE